MHIACYLASSDEFETKPLIEAIWQAGKLCYLPILAEGKILQFSRYDAGDELISNQYSILEPKNNARKIAPDKLDLVLTPLVAFDIKGHRLGAGGGFYDRTFAFMYDNKIVKPLLYGLGYALQQADMLPYDPWDITLHAIVTEAGVIDVVKNS